MKYLKAFSISLTILLTSCSQNIVEIQDTGDFDNIEELNPDPDIDTELDNLERKNNEQIIDRSILEKVNHSHLFKMGIMNCQIIENPKSEVFEEYIENNCSE